MDSTVKTGEDASVRLDLDLYRIGGVAGVAAAILGLVANALHPRLGPSHLGDGRELLDMAAGFGLWRIDHLAIIVALFLSLIALAAISRSISQFAAASWAHVALGSALVTGAIAGVNFSVDGFVLAGVADDWGPAIGPAREGVLERMATIAYFDTAMFTITVISFFGATQLLYGIAFSRSNAYAKWIAPTAVLGGSAGLVAGIWMWMAGGVNLGNFLILFTISSVTLAVWIFGASITLLRKGARSRSTGVAPPHRRKRA